MKKFGFATIVASGLAAAVLGLAGPAQADIGHHHWVHDIQQRAFTGARSPRPLGNGRDSTTSTKKGRPHKAPLLRMSAPCLVTD